MLSTLLDKLGGLLPRSFIIASFFPVLIFALFNGFMLYRFSAAFRRVFDDYFALDASKQALYGAVVLILVSFFGYIFSTLSLFLRELLEGKYLAVFTRIHTRMVAEKQRQLDVLKDDLDKFQRQFFLLKKNSTDWIVRLEKAYAIGNQKSVACEYSDKTPVSEQIKLLKVERTYNRLIEASRLQKIVKDLELQLQTYPTASSGSNANDQKNRRQLDQDHTSLRLLIYYAVGIAENKYVESFNEREFQYSRYKVNATSMGNIGESVRSYSRSRYEINLDSFWSRLQKSIQADEKFYAALIDAKTQLDFLISLFWLTILFTVSWLSFLLYSRTSWIAFILVGVIGPALAALWYEIAKQNYLAFADILRTSIDLFRFDLLAELHVPRPSSSDHERVLWDKLNHLIGYGDATTVRYHHEEKL